MKKISVDISAEYSILKAENVTEEFAVRSVARTALQHGMILGEDVIRQGTVICPAGTVVDDTVVERLKNCSVMCVTVRDQIDSAATRFEKIRFNESFRLFEQKHTSGLIRYKQLLNEFLSGGVPVPDQTLLALYDDLCSTYPGGSVLLDYLYNLVPNEDELTYNHCLNSALLAGAFADWMGLSGEKKDILILSCFYYDIGKMQLPYELLWKPGKLNENEYELVKKHPVIGYSLLEKTDLDQRIKNAVLMHHERMDGSGYPDGLKGSDIELSARYVAIIDTYIAMASPRSYRCALTPLQILGNFEQNMQKFDTALLLPLAGRIADAQIGSTVQMDDDSVWSIEQIHEDDLSRPVLIAQDGRRLDMAKDRQREIMKLL